ncbi:hypothetical protein ACOMHN_062062 [Nucella lapillus]
MQAQTGDTRPLPGRFQGLGHVLPPAGITSKALVMSCPPGGITSKALVMSCHRSLDSDGCHVREWRETVTLTGVTCGPRGVALTGVTCGPRGVALTAVVVWTVVLGEWP